MADHQVNRVFLLNSARRWIGEAAHVLDLAQGLRGRGIEVRLFARRGHTLAERAKALGIETTELTFNSQFAPFRDLRDVTTLRQLIREERPQIVHAHRGKDHWTAGVALRGLRNRPALLRTRHVVMPMRNHLMNRWLQRRATDGHMAVSEATRRGMADVLGEERLRQIPVIHSAVDLERFQARARDNVLRETLLRGEEMLIGLVGRLQRIKGQRELIEAASILQREGVSGVRFVIAGHERTPGRRERLERFAREHRVGELLTILTDVKDIAGLVASLDIGVIASVGSEGFSRVACEMMACGVPLVATRVGVLPEIVRDGENGLLCEPGHAEALAARIKRLIEHPELRARLSRAGRAHVEKHHTPDGWIDQILAFYEASAAALGTR